MENQLSLHAKQIILTYEKRKITNISQKENVQSINEK